MARKCVIFLSLFCLMGCAAVKQQSATTTESWPTFTPTPAQISASQQDATLFLSRGYSYSWGMERYSPTGDYFHSERMTWFESDPKIDGVIQVRAEDGTLYANPVAVAQYALYKYALWVHKQGLRSDFDSAADALLSIQRSDGAFPYPIDYNYRGAITKGWVSGMAQGQALSVFARAYQLTGNVKYVAGARKAMSFMTTPAASGGTMGNLGWLDPTLSRRITFEEAPCDCTILNGFIYAAIGLYDWYAIAGDATAKYYFDEASKTIAGILPYYDMGGFTSYDMGHMKGFPIAWADSYHGDHIVLANAMYLLTGERRFMKYRDEWISDLIALS